MTHPNNRRSTVNLWIALGLFAIGFVFFFIVASIYYNYFILDRAKTNPEAQFTPTMISTPIPGSITVRKIQDATGAFSLYRMVDPETGSVCYISEQSIWCKDLK